MMFKILHNETPEYLTDIFFVSRRLTVKSVVSYQSLKTESSLELFNESLGLFKSLRL